MSKREIRYVYYYNFKSTGVDAVDDILDRVGAAGTPCTFGDGG